MRFYLSPGSIAAKTDKCWLYLILAIICYTQSKHLFDLNRSTNSCCSNLMLPIAHTLIAPLYNPTHPTVTRVAHNQRAQPHLTALDVIQFSCVRRRRTANESRPAISCMYVCECVCVCVHTKCVSDTALFKVQLALVHVLVERRYRTAAHGTNRTNAHAPR